MYFLNFILLGAIVGINYHNVVGGSPYHNNHMLDDRKVMTHLFEWRWDEIARECEQFLGPYGYGAVQVSVANEHIIMEHRSWNKKVQRPWWERYQPVSYKIISRSGNEDQFRNMVHRCNRAKVRIYVDVVLNHMTGAVGKGHGIGGSYYDSDAFQYDGVPFGKENFNIRE